MSTVEFAARALLAADDTFRAADDDWGRPRTWDDLSEDAQEDYLTRARAFLEAYRKLTRPSGAT